MKSVFYTPFRFRVSLKTANAYSASTGQTGKRTDRRGPKINHQVLGEGIPEFCAGYIARGVFDSGLLDPVA